MSSKMYTRIKRPLNSDNSTPHRSLNVKSKKNHRSATRKSSVKKNRSLSVNEQSFRSLFEKLLESRETEPERRYHQLELDCQERCRVSDEKVELYRKKLQCVIDENKSLQKQLQDAVEKLNNAHCDKLPTDQNDMLDQNKLQSVIDENENLQYQLKKTNEKLNNLRTSRIESPDTEAMRHDLERQLMTVKAYQKFNRLDIEPLPISNINRDKETFKIRSQDLEGFEFMVRYNKATQEFLYTPCFDTSKFDPSKLPTHLQEEIYFDNCSMLIARILISVSRLLEQKHKNEQS